MNNIKILTIDPSGEKGTTGTCLIDTETKRVIFRDNYGETVPEIIKGLYDYIKLTKPNKIVYETTKYIDEDNHDRTRITSLFKIIGAIEGFRFCFDFIQSVESVFVNSVKSIKDRIYKQELWTPGINYTIGRGKGGIFTHAIPNHDENRDKSGLDENKQRISLHQLDAIIIYKLGTGECKAQEKGKSSIYREVKRRFSSESSKKVKGLKN